MPIIAEGSARKERRSTGALLVGAVLLLLLLPLAPLAHPVTLRVGESGITAQTWRFSETWWPRPKLPVEWKRDGRVTSCSLYLGDWVYYVAWGEGRLDPVLIGD
jgi:hypothetical protein